MEVIYSLIPGMIMFGVIFLVVLIWAVKKGQYEDFEGDGNRILMDEDEPVSSIKKPDEKAQDSRNWPDAD